jgi:hypothetical protein
MVDPVSSRIWGEGEMIYGIFVDLVIQSEEDTEASVCEKCMCAFGKNVIA